jgi:hypothetical protein
MKIPLAGAELFHADRHDEVFRRFSQNCEKRLKTAHNGIKESSISACFSEVHVQYNSSVCCATILMN